MATRNFDSKKVSSQEQNEPRLLGSIVEEMLHGNSPLAKGYRQYIVSQENGEAEEPGWNANTELGVNLKTMLRTDRAMRTGKDYLGVLRRDADGDVDDYLYRDPHYTFVEALPWLTKRNPCVFRGRLITVTRRDDGSLRPNFRPLHIDKGFAVDGYALEVAGELRRALKGLVEEM